MEDILVFGASRGGENFIKNYKLQYNILAIIDNDSQKQGCSIEKIPVISADDILKFSYDYIIVTSMYIHSITKQLMELGVHKEKIKYASKNSMKVISYPFKNREVLKRAEKMIGLLSEILNEVKHFYTFGTLLGIVRDGQLIPWDDDIDIAIFAEDVSMIQTKLLIGAQELNEIFQTKIYLRSYEDNRAASITIDCYYLNELIFNINLDCIYISGDIAKQELNKTPLKHFEKAEQINFNGQMINIPQHYEDYLTYTYGDWKVVKENTSFYDNTLSFIEPKLSYTSELIYDGVTR